MRQVFVLLLCDNSSDQGRRDAHKPIQLTPLQMLLQHQTSDQEPDEGRVFFLLRKAIEICIININARQKAKG